ncbi:MAG TPA: pitrilysin family protein [Mycobacteriales bacterium]|nr:pitrilysin family protein [Mycobacteriales bacterium]
MSATLAAAGQIVVPALSKAKPLRLPTVSDTELDSGLRVLAVRRPGVPLVEFRLRIPFTAPPGRAVGQHVARSQLLSDTLLSGTAEHGAADLAAAIQALGGAITASVDADRLGLGGSVLASSLPALLDLLAEVLVSASYPSEEVVGERERLVQELAIHRSQAGVVAREVLLHRMYGAHPYGHDLPQPEEIERVTAAALRTLHGRRVAPQGAVLTLVGDLQPAKATAAAAQALQAWAPTSASRRTPAPPAIPPPGAALLVDRPGAVQTTLRLAGPAPSRGTPDAAAFTLANLVFGGYFSSRWVSNIREDKGYTYSPHAQVEHPAAGSRVVISADVATDVTAPALLETRYELGRIATVAVGQDELDQARRYAIGTLALGTASQAGLASTISVLAGAGLELGYLREHQRALEAATVDEVLAAGARYLAPANLTTVLVGDAANITGPLRRLIDIEDA